MTEEQRCDWEISTSLLSERDFVVISQKDQRATVRPGHLEKGLMPTHETIWQNGSRSVFRSSHYALLLCD